MKRDNRKRKLSILKIAVSVLTFFIIVSAIWIFLLNPKFSMYLDQEDKKNFEQTLQDVKQLTKVMTNSSNPESEWKGEKACNRPGVKFDSSKEASCIVNYSSSKKFTTLQEAKQLGKDYEMLIKQSNDVEFFIFNNSESKDFYQVYNFKFNKVPKKIKCYLLNEYKKENESITIKSTLDCSGRARDAWFPLSNV